MRYYVERQQWAHWPKTLVVVRDDGETVERRAYVPASDGPIDQSDAAEAPSWAEIGAAKAEIGALTARIAELKAELDAKYEEIDAKYKESEFWKISHDSMKAMRIEAEQRLADSAERIEELEAELEAEREESAYLDAECDRLSVAIADMEQTHMKLPLDADGVPIRPGERLTFEMNDPGMCTGYDFMLREGRWMLVVRDSEGRGGCRFLAADKARHVKPETIFGILEELALRDDLGRLSLVSEEDELDELLAGYAERIRKAVE